LIYEAVRYYKDGLYLEGEASWNQLLRYNAKFILAYKALAKASMKKGDYETALRQFKLAEDRQGYSDAFWQVRDRWIRANLGWVLLPIGILILVYVGFKVAYRLKPAAFAKPKEAIARGKRAPIVNETLLMFTFIRRPRETIYEIKYKKRASLYGAIFLYVLFAALQILKVYLTGYLFNDVGRSDGLRTILFSTLPLLFLVICNYAVSSVRDGEGKLKDIFIGFIYALSPYLILALPLFLLSNALTFNEAAIFHLVEWAVYIWCGANIIFTVMELHDYSFWQAILNILLTLVCFVLILAFALILYALGYQLFSYLGSLITEAFTR
ncbi:MAG: YIP1 family protein, partial [Bacilli bacterium]|nr:YIP1 family protein [Bacilli bacterium]